MNKRVLITGANRGIGLALAQQLAERGDEVVAVCRKASPALRALPVEHVEGIDVVDAEALAGLAERLGPARLDWLLLNAGVLSVESLGSIDAQARQRIIHQFEVNALGPLLCAEHLLPCLARPGRIGILTSRMGSIGDNGSGGYYGYRMSKAAVNAVGRSLAMDLKPQGISVFLLHPGFVRTDMTGGQGEIDAAFAARGLIERMDTLADSDTGSFWHANGQALPW